MRDHENIGWAAPVYINKEEKTILLVRNLKREAQLEETYKEAGIYKLSDPREQAKKKWPIFAKLREKGLLEKPGKWELPGGKIAWWEENPALREEFKVLKTEEAREDFLKEIWKRSLYNDELLLKAAEGAVERELLEETGIILTTGKRFIKRYNDKDRNYPNDLSMFYPRFWYLVERIDGGELKTEPTKKTISAPKWIPLMQLHPHPKSEFPFHPSHANGVIAAAKYFLKTGHEDFRDVIMYLESKFGPEKMDGIVVDRSWEELAETVQRLN